MISRNIKYEKQTQIIGFQEANTYGYGDFKGIKRKYLKGYYRK